MSTGSRARNAATRKAGQARPLRWSGYDWYVRGSTSSAGPGPNAWSDTPLSAEVDNNGHLRLNLYSAGGTWKCVELEGPHLGYGQYTWVVNTDPTDWDVIPVLGLFTYDGSDDGSHAYRELDIEFSLWNYAPEPSRVWYSMQPTTVSGQTIEDRMSDHAVSAATPYTCTFIWQPGQVYYATTDANGKILGEHVCTDTVQPPGTETVRINLWLQNGTAPLNNQPLSVQVNSFSFMPNVTHNLVAAANTSITFSDGTPGELTLKTGASITSQRLSVACGSPDYNVAFTGSIFNLTGSAVDTHIVQVPAVGNGTTEALFFLRYDPDNYAVMFVSAGGLYARLRQGGVNITGSIGSYSSTDHAYWRIREASGVVYFETSPDRSVWTTQYTHAHNLGSKIQTLRVRYECGYYGTETSPVPLLVGAINAV